VAITYINNLESVFEFVFCFCRDLGVINMIMECKKNSLFTGHEKIPARNSIYAHAQDFAVSDELLLAILKAFLLQPLNKQQTVGVHMFTCTPRF
jgi:hypothetical protein